ncbi:hypothetical protein BCR41DRAFT_344114 [Lobosporangium transversale]|uniref:F-box domain-containing protein n=1 Tax=Lobosporangium transversale TaxID=64571 RepID=A0A1Y2H459_9FUNG|nr:hypothetical protein BCR41DRAFT_344114 [Lobosporangium transversale]ORZ28814.1 hypothetical protein BCR41DRAFT_344114 [Lobosporangium transversale]|eukprot:XP_021886487.1 hypothetical protein BCR41DRAFT_344114 [Lobosporangium transversale]
MNIKVNPLDIPEIILLIGGFLSRKDLLNCIRVSKTFHGALIGFIWRKIIISYRGHPTGEALQNNKKYIEEIFFQDCIPEEYTTLHGCDRLQFIANDTYSCSPQQVKFSGLLRAHNSTITGVRLTSIQSSPELFKLLLECSNLKHLKLSKISINDEVDLFFQVCKRLRRLDLDNTSIHQLPIGFLDSETSEYILSNIRTLSIDHVNIVNPPHPYASPYCLGILTRRCPGLCTLKFYESSESKLSKQPRYDHFYKAAFFQHSWTLGSLSDLSIPQTSLKDEEMATLLGRMTTLRRLYAPLCEFGQLSLQELLADRQEILDNGHVVQKTRLRRLCETIEELKFNYRNPIMDGVIQTILSNCPRLEQLAGAKITVTEIVNGAEWVSTRLTDLAIYLEADINQESTEGMEKQRIVFRRLGKLTQLRHLKLTTWSPKDTRKRTLNLRLGAGLDELASLKVLRTLTLSGDLYQRMHLEDATWIVNNWPSIKYLNGGGEEAQMRKNHGIYNLFRSHNIVICQ